MAEVRNQNRDEKDDRPQPQRSERETSQQISKREPSRGLSNYYDPFRMMTGLHREMDRLFGTFGFGSLMDRSWSPQIEMYERDNKLIVSADLPGLDKNDVKVEINRLEGSDDMKFNTVSGDVSVMLPGNLDADVDMSSFSGSIKTDFAIEVKSERYGSRNTARGKLGEGSRRLKMSTVSGDISLRHP